MIDGNARSPFATHDDEEPTEYGCSTRTNRVSGRPRLAAWRSAVSRKAVVERNTAGTPAFSNHTVSCTLHDVHAPQSATPSMTNWHSSRICSRRSIGATRVNQGFVYL